MKISIFMRFILVISLLSLISVGSYELLGKVDEKDNVSSINVMTYNVHLFYDEGVRGNINLENIKTLIENSGADIIALQESDGNRMATMNQNGLKWLANSLNMDYHYGANTKDGIWGVSILSRWEITKIEVAYLPSAEALQRIAVIATITVPSIGEVNVLATHLTYQSAADQLSQIKEIIKLTSGKNFIIMGDFNTVIAQEAGDTLLEDEGFQLLNDTFADGWVLAGGTDDVTTSYPFADQGIENSRIDYIWLLGDWIAVEDTAKIFGEKTDSDHRAIMIEVIKTQ